MVIFEQKESYHRNDIIIEFKENGDFEYSTCIYGGSPSGDWDDPNDFEQFIFVKEVHIPVLYEKLSLQNNLSDDILQKFIEEHSKDFSEVPDKDRKYFAMIWIHFGNDDGFYQFSEFLKRNRIECETTVWG